MNDTNEAILQTIRRIEDNIARIDLDMEKDRQGIQDLNIRSKAVEAELVEIRKAVNQTAIRTRDRVAEAVQPLIDSTDKLEARVKKSRMVVLKEETKTIWTRIWKLLFR
jgi:hypothetical protein